MTLQALAAQGTSIKDVQTALNVLGYASPPLAVDGVIGPLTTAAVKAFQAHVGITVDGVVGPVTLQALHVAMANAEQTCAAQHAVGAAFDDDLTDGESPWGECEQWGGEFGGQWGTEQCW
ncbi:MAG: peptidoglycan-binding domain-containing protein [Acidimicrobiales bacterium]